MPCDQACESNLLTWETLNSLYRPIASSLHRSLTGPQQALAPLEPSSYVLTLLALRRTRQAPSRPIQLPACIPTAGVGLLATSAGTDRAPAIRGFTSTKATWKRPKALSISVADITVETCKRDAGEGTSP